MGQPGERGGRREGAGCRHLTVSRTAIMSPCAATAWRLSGNTGRNHDPIGLPGSPAAGCEVLLAASGWKLAAAKEELLEDSPAARIAAAGRRGGATDRQAALLLAASWRTAISLLRF